MTAPWPTWVHADLRAALVARGIAVPWAHQAHAADLAFGGTHVVLATGTASGKSLAYQLPALTRLLDDPRATVLYLAPTKALAADQLRSVAGLGLDSVRPATYDGDTPRDERDWVRQFSRFVLTNPDMLHHALLPGHAKWATFLRRLSYVVIDECHAYRGVFGSHVAHVLRRLRRLAAKYGGRPTFVLASATSGDPAGTAGRLTGLPVTAVTEDASPRAAVTFALWEPPLLELEDPDAPLRRSAVSETADLLTASVAAGTRTLAFIRSRRGAEVVASISRRALDELSPGLGARVAAYRGGYLPEDRRALEQALLSGELLALASTNALELGVDLVGLDAVLICGYPGTRASVWQQAGRAGRAGGEALAVLVARDDPLDTYLVRHPSALFGQPVEVTVLDPANPYVLGPQLCAAASEAAADRGRPFAVRWRAGRRGGRGAGRGGCAASAAVRLVLDPPRPPVRRPARHRRRAGRGGRGGEPAGCSARWIPVRPTSCCIPAPSTSIRARRSWSTISISTVGSRWCTPRNRTGRRTPGTSPTCPWSPCRSTWTPAPSACSSARST